MKMSRFPLFGSSEFTSNQIFSLSVKGTVLASLMLFVMSCSGANFKGSSGSGGSDQTPPATPTPAPSDAPIPTGPAPEGPICQDGQQAIGSNITFMIDNSSSNGATDCPGGKRIGQVGDVNLMECASETGREKAVLSAFDVLAEVATKDGREAAVSNLSVIQFPGQITTGSARQEVNAQTMTNGWLRSNPAESNRTQLSAAMQFTRKPYGSTPIGAAIDSGISLFSQVPTDGRSRVVVLVTDGEPTDANPADVSAKADQLKALGVEVISVFVTNGQTRQQRIAAHEAMLRGWEDFQVKNRSHYYKGSYASFDEYLNSLLGKNGQASLIQSVTSKTDITCTDKQGSICQRYSVEVADASALSNVFKQIIRSKVIKCK
jgi:hypothetical protein